MEDEDDDLMVDELGQELEQEIEQEEEGDATSNPIEDLIDYIGDKNYNQAEKQFNSLINDRLQVAIDQTRVKVASQIFNNADVEQEEFDDEEEEISQN